VSTAAHWPLRRIINVSVAAVALFSVAAILVGGIALTNLAESRERVVGRIDPALLQSLRLEAALVDQETGVRGYALGANDSLLRPFAGGQRSEQDAVGQLEDLVSDLPAVEEALGQVTERADRWRSEYAEPTVAEVDATGRPVASNTNQGQIVFDTVRAALNRLQASLIREREVAADALGSSAATLNVVCIAIAVGFVLIVVTLGITLRSSALRPVSRLAEEVRVVARGDIHHVVEQSGPKEVRELGADVNRMRERIVQELAALQDAHAVLDARTQDLERSNQELEQFAYVASHDLQEPLRKVASFCQLLERRYGGKLDDRADQYIGFAVDGAKRMQILINDLLAFSRVGRMVREPVVVSCDAVLNQATTNLATAIEQSGAIIESGELPAVRAEVPLLTTVFQNLISNALKFRGEAVPHVTVSARRDGEFWEFAIADNGIGIDADYAERIFVIFQRLHNKADYPGTGIGLAMCRKIVEYHGGTIWLDTGVEQGSRFCFTLPALPDPEPAPDEPATAGDDPGEDPADDTTRGTPAAENTRPPKEEVTTDG
jgi:signal transduction histidine kinase